MCPKNNKILLRIAVQTFEVVYGPQSHLCEFPRQSAPK